MLSWRIPPHGVYHLPVHWVGGVDGHNRMTDVGRFLGRLVPGITRTGSRASTTFGVAVKQPPSCLNPAWFANAMARRQAASICHSHGDAIGLAQSRVNAREPSNLPAVACAGKRAVQATAASGDRAIGRQRKSRRVSHALGVANRRETLQGYPIRSAARAKTLCGYGLAAWAISPSGRSRGVMVIQASPYARNMRNTVLA